MLATDYDEKRLVHLPRINISTVPHDRQRYETCGDYSYNDQGELDIMVSESTPHYEFLIAVHELIEWYLTATKGISEKDITGFDLMFEDMRTKFPLITGDKEPGDEDAAPYYHEHQMASRVEKWLADSIGVDWEKYSKIIGGLKKV